MNNIALIKIDKDRACEIYKNEFLQYHYISTSPSPALVSFGVLAMDGEHHAGIALIGDPKQVAGYSPNNPHSNFAVIRRVVVKPEFEGKGIMKTIVETINDEFRQYHETLLWSSGKQFVWDYCERHPDRWTFESEGERSCVETFHIKRYRSALPKNENLFCFKNYFMSETTLPEPPVVETPPVDLFSPGTNGADAPPAGSCGCDNCPGKAALEAVQGLQSELTRLVQSVDSMAKPIDYAPQLEQILTTVQAAEKKAAQAVKLSAQTAAPVPSIYHKTEAKADPLMEFVKHSLNKS